MTQLYPSPTTFDEYIIHRPIADNLRIYGKVSDLPASTIFYGGALTGKRTIIRSLIQHSVGEPIKTHIKKDSIYTHGNTMSVEFVVSPFHIEFNLEEYGLTDRYIVGDYIKSILSASTIVDRIRIYVIYGVDSYTYATQDMFVNLIESYASTARFILTSRSINKIHPRLLSISQPYRVPLPLRIEITSYLKSKSSNLSLADIESITDQISKDGNLGILRYRNANYTSPYDITWKLIEPHIEKKDITSINEIKPHFYNIITLTLPTNELIYKMRNYVITKIPDNIDDNRRIGLISTIQSTYASIEHKMKDVNYDIIGLEYAALITKRFIHVIFKKINDARGQSNTRLLSRT